MVFCSVPLPFIVGCEYILLLLIKKKERNMMRGVIIERGFGLLRRWLAKIGVGVLCHPALDAGSFGLLRRWLAMIGVGVLCHPALDAGSSTDTACRVPTGCSQLNKLHIRKVWHDFCWGGEREVLTDKGVTQLPCCWVGIREGEDVSQRRES